MGDWHPRRFLGALRAIDSEASGTRGSSIGYVRPAIVLCTVAVCLFLIHYLKFDRVLSQFAAFVSTDLLHDQALLRTFQRSAFRDLMGEVWWTAWHLVGYVAIPAMVIRFALRERLAGFGFGMGETFAYWKYYVALATPIVGFAFIVSFRADFAAHYPFYDLAARSVFDLLAWEFLYVLQFIALEFFFRGFMLHALKPTFGANAIFVMCVPYLMIHFAKPWLEALGAFPFGLLLGVLALRSRSIWGGVAVHATVAVSMDLFALAQGDRFPLRWWP